MTSAEFQLRGVDDPRLAVHATSHLPAWLWAADGARILWANPVGAEVFGAVNAVALADRSFGPADQHRRQVAQLAARLSPTGAVRLERLRGFGATLGALVTCACARLDFPDGGTGILVTAAAPVGRSMPLIERLQRLVDGVDTPIAAFARDGMFAGASEAARALLGFSNLGEAGLEAARNEALRSGRAETPIGLGHMVLQRVGSGADVGLVALLAPGAMHAPVRHTGPLAASPPATPSVDIERSDGTPVEAAADTAHAETNAIHHDAVAAAAGDMPPAQPVVPEPTPAYEQPATTGEAPVEFALFDAFDEAGDASLSSSHAEPVGAELETTDAIETTEVRDQDNAPGNIATPTSEPTPTETPDTESAGHEPSPYVEAVADELTPDAGAAVADATSPLDAVADDPVHTDPMRTDSSLPPAAPPHVAPAPAWFDEPTPSGRRHPLRFMWQIDSDDRFSLGSDEFTRLIGHRTAAGFGRLWSEIADAFDLDPEGRVANAVATRDTWSGITLHWPVDGATSRLAVELSGLPIFDRARNFAGYRGFGVCRDLDGLARLAAQRRNEFLFNDTPHPLSASAAPSAESDTPAIPSSIQPTEPEPVETPKNVLPFRHSNDPRSPSLTPVENSAFNELARQLSARLENEGFAAPAGVGEIEADHPHTPEPVATETPPPVSQPADAPAAPSQPARGDSARERLLFDLLPTGVLIYRLDRLLYANAAFLARIGYHSLHALEEAGGLDALFVEPGVSPVSSTSETGTPVIISAARAADDVSAPPAAANLHSISWDGEPAHALIFAHVAVADASPAAPQSQPSPVGHATAEELGAILDTTAEGIVMFDEAGRINACNRSAEALFGYRGDELTQLTLADLFAPESRQAVQGYLDGVKTAGAASLLDHGREALGRVREGGFIALSMTMGRTQTNGPNFFAVFRDLSQVKKTETELLQVRRQADRAATAKADVLARISHEVRTPLNAIIGFAEVMIGEKFGPLGNERYVEYMKDIRASGERVIAIVDDLLDLSRIETGKLNLAFSSQSLNEMVEQCVAVMQPQANRERIIIRTSLAHTLPPVVADARALRQIALNLIGNSIHLARAGGQVIVSTALSDFGEVVLRVRDTGHGLNDNEVAAAMEPFRTPAPSDQASESAGVSLSLTKALVEANRAQFQIKTSPHAGTLIEVIFAQAKARASD